MVRVTRLDRELREATLAGDWGTCELVGLDDDQLDALEFDGEREAEWTMPAETVELYGWLR